MRTTAATGQAIVSSRFWTRFAARCSALAGLWWILTEGSGGWGFAATVIPLIAWLGLRSAPARAHRIRPSRLPVFIVFFLHQSLRAGVDVAARTLKPSLPLQPALLRVPVALPAGAPTWWLMLIISLLPGTLSVRLEGRMLEFHCLDDRLAVERDLRHTEARIADLFGCDRKRPGVSAP